jgi:hypothetical protein
MSIQFHDGRIVADVVFYSFNGSRGLYEAVYMRNGDKKSLYFSPGEAVVNDHGKTERLD